MKPDYFQNLIASMNFPENIPEEEINKLLKRTKKITVQKDEYFLMAGEVSDRIGYVVSGLLRFYYIDSRGGDITKHFCIENTLAVSYSAFLLGEESRFYIQALEDTGLVVFDYRAYRDLLDGHACWQVVARKLAEMLFILMVKREEELLLYNAQERYLRFIEDYPNLEKRLNQYHIASYLNIAPESLSRIRSNIRQN